MSLLKHYFKLTITLILFVVSSSMVFGQDEVEITPIKMADNVYMLMGQGGNLGVCIGEDGTFLIDDQFAHLNEKIVAAIKSIGGGEVQFLINTHFHGDHTDGNELIGKTGAIIVAHENVRTKLSSENFVEFFNMKHDATAKIGLPVITFESGMTFHYNNDEIEIFSVGPAHTDGDAAVYFKNANVLHGGDILFFGTYPFIDNSNGGTATGMLSALGECLKRCNEETLVIPGHGMNGTYADLVAYDKMFRDVFGKVEALVKDGKTLEDVIAAKPTADYDAGLPNSFIPADDFVRFVYEDLSK